MINDEDGNHFIVCIVHAKVTKWQSEIIVRVMVNGFIATPLGFPQVG